MIHVSGFLKLICQGDESAVDGAAYGSITVSPSSIDNYRVIGLVAECHLIESPVIMELSVQHSTFAGEISLDLKFTSVDTRCVIYKMYLTISDSMCFDGQYNVMTNVSFPKH